ncbi:MAG: delta-60 repeat domain-containing protein [Ignavibacteria bacterium]|nr:delta-60 repeat domain-containing protein [Ignavibacteria bacterium]
MRNALVIPALLLVLGACDSVEPAGPGPAPMPAPSGMITFGTAGKDTYGGLAVTQSGEILFAHNPTGWNQAAQCLKIGAGGAVLWTTPIVGSYSSASVLSLATGPDGKILLLTNSDKILQLAPSGDTLWTRKMETAHYRQAIQLHDGLCVLSYGGGDWWVDTTFRASLLCYDRAGDRTWRTALLPFHSWTTISCLIDVGDGTVLAGGETSAADSPGALLVRLNPVTHQKTAFPIVNGERMEVISMSEVRNGEFGILLKEGTGTGSQYAVRYIFMRWSVDGTLLHERLYGGRTPSSIAWTPDGGFAIAGNDASAVLTKTDGNGVVQWEYTLSRPPWTGPHDAVFPYTITALRAVAQPDGGIVWGGTTDAFGSGLTDAWLMRLHANGSVDSSFGR